MPEGIDGFLDNLDIRRCGEVRVADCRGTIEEHLKPGAGTIDFGAMFRRLERMSYRGHFTTASGQQVRAVRPASQKIVPGEEWGAKSLRCFPPLARFRDSANRLRLVRKPRLNTSRIKRFAREGYSGFMPE